MISPTKILFIHHAAGIGGAPLSLLHTINALNKEKYDIKVLFLKKSDVINLFQQNNIETEIIDCDFYNKRYRYWNNSLSGLISWYRPFLFIKTLISWFLSAYKYAPKYLQNSDADIIHLNSSVLTDWAYAAKKSNKKVVIHIREPIKKDKLLFTYNLFKQIVNISTDRIIAISKDNARRVGLEYKTTVIYNFVPKTFFSETLIDCNTPKIVLYVGGAAKIKGFFTLIKSLKYLEKNIQVYFIGGYPQQKKGVKAYLPKNIKLNTCLKIMRNSDNAIEIGLVNNIFPYLQKCRLLVSPFVVPHFSRPIAEAFSCSRPVIATDIAGMTELVEHNENGILVKKDNAKELAAAINSLYRNENRIIEMGKNAHELATKKFTERNINKIEQLYDSI